MSQPPETRRLSKGKLMFVDSDSEPLSDGEGQPSVGRAEQEQNPNKSPETKGKGKGKAGTDDSTTSMDMETRSSARADRGAGPVQAPMQSSSEAAGSPERQLSVSDSEQYQNCPEMPTGSHALPRRQPSQRSVLSEGSSLFEGTDVEIMTGTLRQREHSANPNPLSNASALGDMPLRPIPQYDQPRGRPRERLTRNIHANESTEAEGRTGAVGPSQPAFERQPTGTSTVPSRVDNRVFAGTRLRPTSPTVESVARGHHPVQSASGTSPLAVPETEVHDPKGKSHQRVSQPHLGSSVESSDTDAAAFQDYAAAIPPARGASKPIASRFPESGLTPGGRGVPLESLPLPTAIATTGGLSIIPPNQNLSSVELGEIRQAILERGSPLNSSRPTSAQSAESMGLTMAPPPPRNSSLLKEKLKAAFEDWERAITCKEEQLAKRKVLDLLIKEAQDNAETALADAYIEKIDRVQEDRLQTNSSLGEMSAEDAGEDDAHAEGL